MNFCVQCSVSNFEILKRSRYELDNFEVMSLPYEVLYYLKHRF